MLNPRHSDDDLIAFTLIAIQSLTTGRTLPSGVRIDELDADTLVEFWADQRMERPVRPRDSR
ncbi:hypothetical protein [Actinomadura rugatobispora]|uniref:Uncharacterized protein n=1 Tax=Actinomadura rugatobispora TaxID=1994 RepID=A0ABW0ZMV6_9ACTN